MVPKINRIKKKKDFELIFKNSSSFKNNLFILKVKENNLGLNRFGFVISSKVSKKAVIRNKIRRRLAEIIKSEIENIPLGTDLVFIALRGIEKKEFVDLKEAVKTTLSKIKLITKNV